MALAQTKSKGKGEYVAVRRAARSALEEAHNDLYGSSEQQWTLHNATEFCDSALMSKLSLLEDGRASREQIEDTLLWVATPIVSEKDLYLYPTSFQAVCTAIGLDPEFLQYQILHIKAPRLCEHLGLEPDTPNYQVNTLIQRYSD